MNRRVSQSTPDHQVTLPLKTAIRADLRISSAWQRVALVGVAFWLAYEWGAGNEALTPWIIARTISSTSGLESILITAMVGFGFTLVQQLASGFTALLGFSLFDRTAAAAHQTLERRLGRAPRGWNQLGIVSRTVLVFGFGTTAVVLLENVSSGSTHRRQQRRVVVQSATLCAVTVAAIAAAAATVAEMGRRVDVLSGHTEFVLRVLGNPLTWIGLVVVLLVVNSARSPQPAHDPRK